MTSDVIVEELCGAISTIVSSALQNLSYDQTIICTIVDNSKSSNGEYKVTDGSTEFVAKSENTSYQKDDQVRVSILKGDMTQEKFIIGKYVNSDSNVPITYMNPLDSVMKMTNNLFVNKNNDNNTVYSLTTNGIKTNESQNWKPKGTEMLLSNITLNGNQPLNINTQIYDTVYVKANFKTIISHYSVIAGHYGLRISLGQIQNEEFTSNAEYIFDSSQMFGDPYNFGIYTSQAAKFDIKTVGTINAMKIYLYQDGNFKQVIHTNEAEFIESNIQNIFVKNIEIGFGNNVINVADDTIKLFSLDQEQYDGDDSMPDRLRELKIAWYNKNDLGQNVNFNDAAVLEEITNDNIIKTIKIGDSLIKFINEYKYREISETNNRRNVQVDYDIPMDIQGLELAAAIKKINEKLKSLSLILSKDLHQTIEKFKARCNISVFTEQYDNYKISAIINNQYISMDSTNTLPKTIDTFFKNYMDALNRAAKKYNTVPSTLSGEGWTFKAKTTDKPENSGDWNETTLFETYFETTLKNYLNNFLSSLKTSVSSSYSGYMGIYDNYESKINKILNNVENQWKEIKLILNTFNYPISTTQNSISQSLTNAILSYWNDNYTFLQWTAQDLTKYENAYSIYWYRSNKLTTDSIAGKGWELIAKSYNENNVENSIDYTNYEQIKILLDPTKEKEEFKVLLFFNHRQHESNTIIFENTTDFNKQIADASNYITIAHGTNSQESYQSYGPTNTLLNGAEKYRSRELNISYTNHETGQIENNHLENAQIYWYIPKHSTMLIYDTNDLINLNETNHFINDLNSTIDNTDKASERQKSGYIMFYKTIKDLKKDLKFSYRIKDYYVPSATQNHILCDVIIDDVIYTSEILMNFSSYGTSGSDYTLVVSPQNSQSAIIADNIKSNPFIFNINLFDNKNQMVDLSEKSISYSLLNKNNSGLDILEPSSINTSCGVFINTYEKKDDNNIIIKDENGNPIIEPYTVNNAVLADILEVKVSNITSYDLIAYYPIAFSASAKAFIEGASTVIYDSGGGFPSYYKDPYKYYDIEDAENSGIVEKTNITWTRCFTPTIENNSDIYNKIIPYMPVINEHKKLVPSTMWVNDCNVYNWKEIITSGETVDRQKIYYTYIEGNDSSGNVVWRQPLIIMQNRYPSPMLNAWDGSLKIDEENGTIMSTMIGAGRKNKENAFEGILMGDIATGAELNNHTIGLYGFHNGEQSFGFKIDGTAFLGKSGTGRLEFDGNNGSIKSSSYVMTGKSGMFIDFNNGKILMKGAGEKSFHSSVTINTISPYFSIVSAKGKSLMHIADDGYYLETDNYSSEKENQEGIRLDLAKGSLIGYNFNLEAHEKGTENYIQLNSSGAPYFRVHFNKKNLINIEKQKFDFCSANWETGKSGTQINLMDGTIVSYGFSLTASNDKNQTIALSSSTDTETPFNVNNAFTIKWDGTTSIGNGTILITPEGTMTATGATLNDLTVVGATLTNLTVNQDAQFNGSINSTGNASFAGTATFGGNTSITGDLKTRQGQVELGGNTYVTGVLTIGSKDSEDSGSLMTYGPVTVIGNLNTSGGTVTLGGDTQVSGTLTIGKQDMAGSGALNLYGSADIYNTFTIHKKLHLTSDSENLFEGKVTCAGAIECQKTLSTIASCSSTFNGAINVNGTLTVTPKATFKGGFLSEGPATFQGAIKIREHRGGTYADYSGTSATQVKLDIPWSLQYATLTFKNGILTEIEYNDKKEDDETKVSQSFVDKNYVYHGKGKRIEFNQDNISALFSNNFPPASHNNEKHSETYITAEYSKFTEITNSLQGHAQRLDTIEKSYVTSDQLKGYVTSTVLEDQLKGYVTSEEANDTYLAKGDLQNYDYITLNTLNTMLANYGTTAQIAELEKRITDLEAMLFDPPTEEQ